MFIALRRLVVYRPLSLRMYSNKFSYEDAVRKLNSLQSNKSTIEQIRKNIRKGQLKCTNLEDMENYLSRTGVSLSKLDQLSVIHIAGTKGKEHNNPLVGLDCYLDAVEVQGGGTSPVGLSSCPTCPLQEPRLFILHNYGSTSALCESILRHHGFRTGFYSSPHLVAVRERIRLDGRVITEDKFADHFHRVYDMLNSSKAHEGDMPGYFAFLTVLAFNTFLSENVDVAIVEVGIGGLVDYTNVLRKVPVVGITALGLDHTSILGHSLPEIAAAKAGVLKRGCVAYTVPQPPEAMEVLSRVAHDVQCPLKVVPEYESYKFPNGYKTRLQTNEKAYQTNASLAIQLAHAWLRVSERQPAKKKCRYNKVVSLTERDSEIGPSKLLVTEVPYETGIGLKECRWPGRYQILEAQYARFYLDGAHTKESVEICADWFTRNTGEEDKILIFSTTGDRQAEVLLTPLKGIKFTRTYFVVPAAYKVNNMSSDNYSAMEQAGLFDRCHRHLQIWKELSGYNDQPTALECVADALMAIKKSNNGLDKPSVLITGSLHLVGAALSILDPNLSAH